MESPEEHNAGFDSFMTGICFIAMADSLDIKIGNLNANSKILSNKKNRIFCMRLQDVNYINLVGKERKYKIFFVYSLIKTNLKIKKIQNLPKYILTYYFSILKLKHRVITFFT